MYNGGVKTGTYSRVNISLPRKTLQRLDATAERGDRSRLIDTAVNFYLSQQNRKELEKLLKEGAIKWRERDRQIAEEMARANDPWPDY